MPTPGTTDLGGFRIVEGWETEPHPLIEYRIQHHENGRFSIVYAIGRGIDWQRLDGEPVTPELATRLYDMYISYLERRRR